ncbi:MAG TPA: ATP-binding protein [Candidatus Paceibacterota bacterium]|nr:ATP-binding protein [Candidatus Paceibacterota bacterium]
MKSGAVLLTAPDDDFTMDKRPFFGQDMSIMAEGKVIYERAEEPEVPPEYQDQYFDREAGAERKDFKLPNTTETVRYTADEIERRMNAVGWPEDQAYRVRTALDEMFSNAVGHGNLHLPSLSADQSIGAEINRTIKEHPELRDQTHVYVTIEALDEDKIVLRVRDEGAGFPYDQDNVPDPTAEENLLKPNGRGLYFITQFFDEASWEKGGTEIRVVKHRHHAEQPVR